MRELGEALEGGALVGADLLEAAAGHDAPTLVGLAVVVVDLEAGGGAAGGGELRALPLRMMIASPSSA
ncbi:MAG: hypothetical protein R2701_00495 [Acidimicrobiales bacterium]